MCDFSVTFRFCSFLANFIRIWFCISSRLVLPIIYGIDKIRKWKSLTGMDVTFSSEIAYSTVTYYRNNPATTGKTTGKTTDKTYQGVKEVILRAMQSSPSITIEELSAICHLSQDGVRYHI